MAAHARRSGQVVVIADVAHCAGRCRMLSGQGKARHRVIERRWLPGHGGVAILTSLRKVQRNMVEGRQGRLIIQQVARYARNARKLRVIECRPRPAIDAVADRAIGRKFRGHMVRRFGLLKLLRVTGIAIRRKPFELPCRSSLVTGVALNHRMRADQRKAVLVILDRADVRFPTFDRVAGFAIRAHLTAMNIGMAVRAFSPHIRKHRLGVARRARNIGVQAAQRILRLAVIKFRNRASRLPSRLRMAILARNRQRPVRTPRAVTRGASSGSRRSGHPGRQPQKHNR